MMKALESFAIRYISAMDLVCEDWRVLPPEALPPLLRQARAMLFPYQVRIEDGGGATDGGLSSYAFAALCLDFETILTESRFS